jgi:hypothetical protein
MHQTLTARVTLSIAGRTRLVTLRGKGLQEGERYARDSARFLGWLRWGAKDFIPYSLVFVASFDWR